jgi:methionyl-tRNA formyltransferase
VPPGEIAGVSGDALAVRCSDGTVDVLELIPPNRPAQKGAAFAQSFDKLAPRHGSG